MAVERTSYLGVGIQSLGIVSQTDPEAPAVSAIGKMGLQGGAPNVVLSQSNAPAVQQSQDFSSILRPDPGFKPGGLA